jgi:hypothetical protein
MGIYGPQIRRILTEEFSYDELLALAIELGANLDDLPGESRSAKARELFAYMSRHKRLSDLEEYIVRNRPEFASEIGWTHIGGPVVPGSVTVTTERDEFGSLNIELAQLRQELQAFQKNAADSDQLEQRIQDMVKLTSRAIGRSEELTARIVLPPQELTDVHLVPTHSLDRLEEYRSDENIAYLLIGAFGGAILGIISNWVTSTSFVITQSSGILAGLLIVLTVASILWTHRIHKRADLVKKEMLSQSNFRSSKEAA